MFGQKNNWKKEFGQENFGKKKWVKKFFGQKNVSVQQNFGLKQKFYFHFGSNKLLGQKYFVLEKILCQKKLWVKQNILSNKILGPKKFSIWPVINWLDLPQLDLTCPDWN